VVKDSLKKKERKRVFEGGKEDGEDNEREVNWGLIEERTGLSMSTSSKKLTNSKNSSALSHDSTSTTSSKKSTTSAAVPTRSRTNTTESFKKQVSERLKK